MASKASPAATDRQDCAGLRSRPACLPAVAYVNSIRLADPRGCPKDWGYEDSVPSRHKKSSLSGCYFVRAQERSDRRGYRGKHSPCPGAVRRTGDTKTLSLRGTKKQPIRLLFLCERRDSNPYAQRHQILSLAWLPITTRSQNPSEGL